METGQQSFIEFLSTAHANGTLTTDDVIACVMPLFRGVMALHEEGKVLHIADEHQVIAVHHQLHVDPIYAIAPRDAMDKIIRLQSAYNGHIEVADKFKRNKGGNGESTVLENLEIYTGPIQQLSLPAYIPGYECYESLVEHHDAQTDIFTLGLILASVTIGLNFYKEEDLTQFVNNRQHLMRLQSKIHPAINTLIVEMTELNRAKRSQDLTDIIHRLNHYRDFNPNIQNDLSQVAGWVKTVNTTRESYILGKLRNRLFDTSRRNRLLYYKPNLRFINLTVSSVPMVVHFKSIPANTLFTWHEQLAATVVQQKDLVLNQYLRFEDHPYLQASLNTIRIESQRDIQEYGFSQLKMAIAFLDWFNLKEEEQERIQSPLLLIPVTLKKKKNVAADQFVLEVNSNVAEVNPVLANYLEDLYGIQLPAYVELEEMSVQQFYEHIRAQIEGANKGFILTYVDKPRVNLVYETAQQTVAHYGRRFGMQDNTTKRATRSTTLELFQLAETPTNKYHWHFDVCNIVLGNFNYKKMSLVRDYNHVIMNKLQHGVFDQLFSAQPKPIVQYQPAPVDPASWQHVVTADPTQTNAVLRGRNGESYVIQGPPGTGKSQTITNLIADFVTRGKHVLFVCEKRAALDVVYHRLKQQGLDELCCYIHDSQQDKKSFIRDLEATYKLYAAQPLDLPALQEQRTSLLKKLDVPINLLQNYHQTQNTVSEQAATTTRDLIAALIALRPALQQLSPKMEEAMPYYEQWVQFGQVIQQLGSVLEDTGSMPIFAEHPLSKVNEAIFAHPQPVTNLENLLDAAQKALNDVLQVLRATQLDQSLYTNLAVLKDTVMHAHLMVPLAQQQQVALIDPANPASQVLTQQLNLLKEQQAIHQQAVEATVHWQFKLDEATVREGLALANQKEHSMLGFMDGQWRKLKQQVNAGYFFDAHPVKPSITTVLQQLLHEYETSAAILQTKKNIQQQYGFQDIDQMVQTVERLRTRITHPAVQCLVHHPQGSQITLQLAELQAPIAKLEVALEACLHEYQGKSLLQMEDELENISMNANTLPDLMPALENYLAMPATLKNAVHTIPFSPSQFEAGMAHKSLRQVYLQQKQFAATDAHTLEKAVEAIQVYYKELMKLNALITKAQARGKFNDHLSVSAQPLSALTPEEKEFKKHYLEGRKILENEFAKSSRFKSIRELASKESADVLKDLKPIWLMSPLSVSDCLPVENTFFDAVIFDEASQITLEEGIPSLYRAPQSIIVGDDKQMPPTDFFTTKGIDKDDLELTVEESASDLLSHDVDSLLAQGARKLDSVMLGWHYRSQFETLINFSNHAFYKAGLLTVPDRTVHQLPKQPIVVNSAAEGLLYASSLYDRSISFHFQQGGVYEKQVNLREAQYIAELVRSFLRKNVKDSIGIVAFSQPQQTAIENALEALAKTDITFDQQLDEARIRVENDQFTGLFVKNLENVQGDERDIIILSVCYAPASSGKMSMHFGPINKKGGEKRLNVIFSRAKKHMAVVSSIKHQQITNEYNAGANYLKQFLQYAEHVSIGAMKEANQVLQKLNYKTQQPVQHIHESLVLQQISRHLQQKGYVTQSQVGQSGFKCSLAIKANEQDDHYALSILVDDDAHYANEDVLEQYFQRPALLENFGWKIMRVLAKDWLHQPKQVVENILKRLHNEPMITQENPASIEKAYAQSVSLGAYENLPYQRFILDQGEYIKSWEIAVDDLKLVTRFGKLGAKGQVQVKTMESQAHAKEAMQQMIKEKQAEGYITAPVQL
ncbi:AAA domain-containing protein [Chitinophaga skermanii]|uniref:AAA domain-containing protein n=1 Tax=Chitinophaga skermanii TaxID=331697 RepID=A0A327QRZ3_9BACT|nr:AAA domain-containing protein [Chitinophaga skermanii]RAJ06728.1 AAA domain-containing protein [Chitinophaga skermanii]